MEIKEKDTEKISGGKVIKGKDGKFYITASWNEIVTDENGKLHIVFPQEFTTEDKAKEMEKIRREETARQAMQYDTFRFKNNSNE